MGVGQIITAPFLQRLIRSLALARSISSQNQLAELTEWYRSGRLVLVLGAGVSSDYGLPDWNTLLQRLLLSTLHTETDDAKARASLLAKTFTQVFSPDPLIAARYLHNHFRNGVPEENLSFENAVRKTIYEELNQSAKSE